MKIIRPNGSTVAAAVALAIGSSGAMAATMIAGTTVYSAEYGALASASSGQSLATDNSGAQGGWTAGAAYQTGDSVVLTLSGAEFATASANMTVVCGASATIAAAGSVTVSATTASFAVATASSNNDQCLIDGALIKNSSVAAASTTPLQYRVTVTRGALTTADEALSSTTFGSVAETLLVVSTGAMRADGVVMMYGGTAANANGRLFTGHNTTDTLQVRTSVIGALNPVNLVSGTAFTVTLSSSATGGFAWMDGTSETATSCATGGSNRAIVTSGNGTIVGSDASCTSLVWRMPVSDGVTAATASVGTTSSIDLTVATTGNLVAGQTFSVASGNWSYSAGGVTGGSKAVTFTPGGFTTNGTRVFIPYMPIGAGISQIVTVANNNAVEGTATIQAIDNSGTACNASSFGTVALGASRVTSLSSAVLTGLTACYGSASSRPAALTITLNVPGEGVEVFSAYNVNGNRVAVTNSSNGKGGVTVTGNVVPVGSGNGNY